MSRNLNDCNENDSLTKARLESCKCNVPVSTIISFSSQLQYQLEISHSSQQQRF